RAGLGSGEARWSLSSGSQSQIVVDEAGGLCYTTAWCDYTRLWTWPRVPASRLRRGWWRRRANHGEGGGDVAVISMKQLLEAGVHFGHQTRRWNPKMAPYIFTERNGIYIIDLQKTVRKVEEAYRFVRDLAQQGGTILFVGTKKQ